MSFPAWKEGKVIPVTVEVPIAEGKPPVPEDPRLQAQEISKGPQPDRLNLGTVYVGSTVEASFQLREEGNSANVKLEIEAPKFVTVRNKSTAVQEVGPKGAKYVHGSVEIALDTRVAGEFRSEVTVTLGKTTVKVPVSATVKAARPGLSRLLVVGTPFEKYSTDDGTAFQAWTDLVKDSPLDVSYLIVDQGKPVLRDLDLRKFDCVLLPPEGLLGATAEDVKRVRAYAENGGRVVVAANRFYSGSVDQANKVLAGYGVQMRNEEQEGGRPNDVVLGKREIDPRLVKAGVQSLRFYRASPTAVTEAKYATVLVRAAGVGQAGDGFVVRARVGKGEMITIGESLWWNWITPERAQGADNVKLLRWLLVRSGTNG